MGEQFYEEDRKAGCHGNLEKASPEECKDESREECNKSCDGALRCFENGGDVWKIPWAEEPGRLQSIGPQRLGHD